MEIIQPIAVRPNKYEKENLKSLLVKKMVSAQKAGLNEVPVIF